MCPICNLRVLDRQSRTLYLTDTHDTDENRQENCQENCVTVAAVPQVENQVEAQLPIDEAIGAETLPSVVSVAASANEPEVPADQAANLQFAVKGVATHRNRSDSSYIDGIQPGRRQRRAESARNIRLAREQHDQVDDVPENAVASRRSKRISIPTKPYNIGVVQCFICKKRVWQNLYLLLHHDGNIACSFKCFNKTQN